jgi:hypothetical protein
MSTCHGMRWIGPDHYRLWWTFDTYRRGSRLRWPRTIKRDTNKKGAIRFSRKWGLTMPTADVIPDLGDLGRIEPWRIDVRYSVNATSCVHALSGPTKSGSGGSLTLT